MCDVQISVVMGVRNEAQHIANVLDDIAAQDLSQHTLELIVADGESADGSKQMVANWIEGQTDISACLIHNPKRWQYPGVNCCIRKAQGEIILVLDGHARIPPDFLRKNLDVMDATGADVVGGLWETRGSDSIWGRAVEGALSTWFGVGGARFRIGAEAGPSDVVPFGCFRRTVFEKVGLYREELGSNADLELFQRVREAGMTIYLDPSIRSIYFARPSLRSLAWQMFRNGRWCPAHLSAVRARHLAPLLFLLACIGLPIAAMAWTPLWGVWVAMIGTYVVVSAITATRIGTNLRSVASGAAAALVFPAVHISYGLGWLVGVFSPDVRKARIRARHAPPSL